MENKQLNLGDLSKLEHMGEVILSKLGIITPVNSKPINLQASSYYEGRLIIAVLISSEHVPFKSDKDRLIIQLNQKGAEQNNDGSERLVRVYIRRDDGYEYHKTITEYSFKTALHLGKNDVGLQNTVDAFVKKYKRYKNPDFIIDIKRAISNT